MKKLFQTTAFMTCSTLLIGLPSVRAEDTNVYSYDSKQFTLAKDKLNDHAAFFRVQEEMNEYGQIINGFVDCKEKSATLTSMAPALYLKEEGGVTKKINDDQTNVTLSYNMTDSLCSNEIPYITYLSIHSIVDGSQNVAKISDITNRTITTLDAKGIATLKVIKDEGFEQKRTDIVGTLYADCTPGKEVVKTSTHDKNLTGYQSERLEDGSIKSENFNLNRGRFSGETNLIDLICKDGRPVKNVPVKVLEIMKYSR